MIAAILRVLDWAESEPTTTSLEDAVARHYAARAAERVMIDEHRRRTRGPVEHRADVGDPTESILDGVAAGDRGFLQAYLASSESFDAETVHFGRLRRSAHLHHLLKQLRERIGRLPTRE